MTCLAWATATITPIIDRRTGETPAAFSPGHTSGRDAGGFLATQDDALQQLVVAGFRYAYGIGR